MNINNNYIFQHYFEDFLKKKQGTHTQPYVRRFITLLTDTH